MARIVKLGQLLPEDIAFDLGDGRQYLVPGDPPLDLILKIADLFERGEAIEAGDEEAGASFGLDVMRELDEEILRLLRLRDPSIETSPFGPLGVQHFVAELLKMYNVLAGVEPDPPTRARTASGSRRKSTRSSGSPSS
jgi:hypothetical protein